MAHRPSSMTFIKGNICGIISHGNKIRHPHCLHTCIDKVIKYLIILIQDSCDLSLIMTTRAMRAVMMTITTFFTAEFLILSAIRYHIPALETLRMILLNFHYILHVNKFCPGKYPKDRFFEQQQIAVFFFI